MGPLAFIRGAQDHERVQTAGSVWDSQLKSDHIARITSKWLEINTAEKKTRKKKKSIAKGEHDEEEEKWEGEGEGERRVSGWALFIDSNEKVAVGAWCRGLIIQINVTRLFSPANTPLNITQ